MADNETPAVAPMLRLRPPWQAWLVVAAACAAVALCAGGLELAIRADLRDTLKVEPPRWSDPQVRAYASARSFYSFPRRSKLLRRALDMKPDGAITAAAASELMVFGPRRDEIKYALLAARVVPADSPMLQVYYAMAAMRLVTEHRAPEAVALLAEGVERAGLPAGRAALLSLLLSTAAKAQGLDAALRLYAQYDRQMPSAAHSDKAQEELAYLLEHGHRPAEADRIRRYLAAHATNAHIRERARKKLAGEGNRGD